MDQQQIIEPMKNFDQTYVSNATPKKENNEIQKGDSSLSNSIVAPEKSD
jgi:hypothetical protein